MPMRGKFFLNVTLLLCTAAKTQTKVQVLVCVPASDLAKVINFKETDCYYSLPQQMK